MTVQEGLAMSDRVSKAKKTCKLWLDFKKKYDGVKITSENRKRYQEDCRKAQSALEGL